MTGEINGIFLTFLTTVQYRRRITIRVVIVVGIYCICYLDFKIKKRTIRFTFGRFNQLLSQKCANF